MEEIISTKALIEALSTKDPDAKVMVAVVTDPVNTRVGGIWHHDPAIEVCPLEVDEVYIDDTGQVLLCVELTDMGEEVTELNRGHAQG